MAVHLYWEKCHGVFTYVQCRNVSEDLYLGTRLVNCGNCGTNSRRLALLCLEKVNVGGFSSAALETRKFAGVVPFLDARG